MTRERLASRPSASDPTPDKRVGLYLRISKDSEGLELGVDRQLKQCRERAEREGWVIVDTFTDNDISASTLSKKPRPEYSRMLADAEAGKFGRILAYSNSRLTRRPLELEALIKLHERAGVSVHTVVSGDDDLTTADGRMVARIKASVDAAEAERVSERVKAQQRQARTNGTYQSRRAFGWVKTPKGQPDTLHPVEAPALAEGIQTVLKGGSVAAVAKAWNASGLTTPAGSPWNTLKVRATLMRPRNAGLVEHKGTVLPDVVGVWEPVCSHEDWEALCAVLRDPGRVTSPGPAPTALASSTARCGVCGEVMVRTGGKGGAIYRCKSGQLQKGLSTCSNSINCHFVDEVIEAVIVAGLVNGDFADRLSPDTSAQSELATLRAERAKLSTKADGLEAALAEAEGPAEMKALTGALKKIDTQRTKLTEQIQSIEAVNPARELFRWIAGPDADPNLTTLSQMAVLAAWDELDISQRRAIVRELVTVTVATGKGVNGKPGKRGVDRVSVSKNISADT